MSENSSTTKSALVNHPIYRLVPKFRAAVDQGLISDRRSLIALLEKSGKSFGTAQVYGYTFLNEAKLADLGDEKFLQSSASKSVLKVLDALKLDAASEQQPAATDAPAALITASAPQPQAPQSQRPGRARERSWAAVENLLPFLEKNDLGAIAADTVTTFASLSSELLDEGIVPSALLRLQIAYALDLTSRGEGVGVNPQYRAVMEALIDKFESKNIKVRVGATPTAATETVVVSAPVSQPSSDNAPVQPVDAAELFEGEAVSEADLPEVVEPQWFGFDDELEGQPTAAIEAAPVTVEPELFGFDNELEASAAVAPADSAPATAEPSADEPAPAAPASAVEPAAPMRPASGLIKAPQNVRPDAATAEPDAAAPSTQAAVQSVVVPVTANRNAPLQTIFDPNRETHVVPDEVAAKYLGQSPLNRSYVEYAKAGNRMDVVEALEMGADPDARDENGTPALVLASYKPFPGTVGAIADGGADLDQPDADGNTAIMVAIIREQNDTVWQLGRRGAKLDVKNNNQETAYDLISKSSVEIQDTFLDVIQLHSSGKIPDPRLPPAPKRRLPALFSEPEQATQVTVVEAPQPATTTVAQPKPAPVTRQDIAEAGESITGDAESRTIDSWFEKLANDLNSPPEAFVTPATPNGTAAKKEALLMSLRRIKNRSNKKAQELEWVHLEKLAFYLTQALRPIGEELVTVFWHVLKNKIRQSGAVPEEYRAKFLIAAKFVAGIGEQGEPKQAGGVGQNEAVRNSMREKLKTEGATLLKAPAHVEQKDNDVPAAAPSSTQAKPAEDGIPRTAEAVTALCQEITAFHKTQVLGSGFQQVQAASVTGNAGMGSILQREKEKLNFLREASALAEQNENRDIINRATVLSLLDLEFPQARMRGDKDDLSRHAKYVLDTVRLLFKANPDIPAEGWGFMAVAKIRGFRNIIADPAYLEELTNEWNGMSSVQTLFVVNGKLTLAPLEQVMSPVPASARQTALDARTGSAPGSDPEPC